MPGKKLNPSIKFALLVAAVLAVAFFGYHLYGDYRLRDVELAEIQPSEVTILALQPGAGYRILVSNEVAKLAQVRGAGEDISGASIENLETDNASILPISAMLGSMQGDQESLNRFVMSLNELGGDNLPALREGRTWTAEQLREVLDGGDPELREELEADLNVTLDGMPLDQINLASVQNGIVIDSPVPVEVSIGGEVRTFEARVQQAFQPSFTRRFESQLENEDVDISEERIAALYASLMRQILEPEQFENPMNRQDVAEAIERLIDPDYLAEYAEAPERVLRNATTVLNNEYIVGASYEQESTNRRDESYKLNIEVNEEGRMRMWKYSHDNPSFQLLLIVDGAAIAAPVISTELRQSPITITRISNERLIKNAVDKMTPETEATQT
ncbi:MAG: hypothetical protein ACOCX1_01460 [Fimbriimonadaceae bacterium]